MLLCWDLLITWCWENLVSLCILCVLRVVVLFLLLLFTVNLVSQVWLDVIKLDGILLSRSWAGGTPVVEWGVKQYKMRYLEIHFSSNLELGNFFMLSLYDCTTLLASLLLMGWWAVNTWRIPLLLMNSSNSALVNWAPLPVTDYFGRPWVANMEWRLSIVRVEVAIERGTISNHLQYASTTRRSILPRSGPAKSAWSLSQGCSGNSQGWNGAMAGLWFVFWHKSHALTLSSKFLSIPGHKTYERLRLFILTLPGWPSCSSSITFPLRWGDTMILLPQSWQPSWIDNLFQNLRKGSTALSSEWHPPRVVTPDPSLLTKAYLLLSTAWFGWRWQVRSPVVASSAPFQGVFGLFGNSLRGWWLSVCIIMLLT